MPDIFAKNDLDEAHRLGLVSGTVLKNQVANCPYQHDALPLRDAWIAGFSEGRIKIAPTKPPSALSSH